VIEALGYTELWRKAAIGERLSPRLMGLQALRSCLAFTPTLPWHLSAEIDAAAFFRSAGAVESLSR